MSFRTLYSLAIEPSRLRGTVFGAVLCLAGPSNIFYSAGAWAQANTVEESGISEKRGEPAQVEDKAFDCGAFRQAIAAAGDGFTPLRGAKKSDGDGIAAYAVNAPLFGACEILEKKKLNEISYSCEAEKLSLADIKATVEACLGDKAFGLASNENPNTPYLRYNPEIDVAQGRVKARVMALNTFGKKTLVIFNPR